MRALATVGALAAVTLAGCMESGTEIRRKSTSFAAGEVVRVVPPPQVPPAALETAARVDRVGRDLLEANKRIGAQPLFLTIGDEKPEVFHVATHYVYVTEGLVKQCVTDAQLAAVLCLELGRMVSEREAKAPASTRQPQLLPPIEVDRGREVVGSSGTADQTGLVEMARYERERKARANTLPPPDPKALARLYLKYAGFAPTELDAVGPVLQSAAANTALEKQITGTAAPR